MSSHVETQPLNRLLSVKQAASALSVSSSQLYNLRRRGVIRFGKLGCRTVVTQTELDRVIASVEAEGSAR